jgi:hypothetical protein
MFAALSLSTPDVHMKKHRGHSKGRQGNHSSADLWVPILGSLFCISGFLFLHEAFKHNLEGFPHEIFVAVMASVFTVVCMAMLMRAQARHERERVFHSHVFQSKLKIYEKLLSLIFEMDDDGIITEQEIKAVENHAGAAALVAGERLVCVLAQFVLQLKLYGRVYIYNLDHEQALRFCDSLNAPSHHENGFDGMYLCPPKAALRRVHHKISNLDAKDYFVSLDEVVQAMRDDLSIVTENVHEVLQSFILVPFDHHKLIRTPNLAG